MPNSFSFLSMSFLESSVSDAPTWTAKSTSPSSLLFSLYIEGILSFFGNSISNSLLSFSSSSVLSKISIFWAHIIEVRGEMIVEISLFEKDFLTRFLSRTGTEKYND